MTTSHLVSDIELFFAGVILSAAAEVEFETFVLLWDGDLARAWEREAGTRGWLHQQYGWGDYNAAERAS